MHVPVRTATTVARAAGVHSPRLDKGKEVRLTYAEATSRLEGGQIPLANPTIGSHVMHLQAIGSFLKCEQFVIEGCQFGPFDRLKKVSC
jgi:hypothetical protein